MPTGDYVHIGRFMQYTGSNSAEIAAWMGRDIISEGGGVLQIGDASIPEVFYTFNTGDWWSQTDYGFWPAAQFNDQYVTKASLAGTDNVGKTEGVSVAVPLLILGASVDRVVTWPAAFADANYNVRFLPDANTLGRITPVVKSGTKTASGLTVTVSAGLAVTVAGVLHVLGSGS